MNYKNITKAILISFLFIFISCGTESENKNDKKIFIPETTIQFGSTYNDTAVDLVKDSEGNIYVLSRWEQIVDESKNLFLSNLKLTKFNKDSKEIWTKIFDSSDENETYIDVPSKLVVDKSNNIYIFGTTLGNIDNEERDSHSFDPFFIKLKSSGEEIIRKQWGSTSTDLLNSAVIDTNGNIYAIGDTQLNFETGNRFRTPDIFITKINNNDEIQWTKYHPTDGYELLSFATISGNDIYITGLFESLDSTNNKDCFLVKFNEENGFKEIPVTETSRKETIEGIAMDKEGNIYITGYTEGDFSSVIVDEHGKIEEKGKTGPTDMFILKLNDDGIKNFKQWGTTGRDEATSITVDTEGNLYIAGVINRNNPPTETDDSNIHLVKMDKDFNEIWSKNKLVKGRTIIGSILLNDNEIYLTGHTLGNFDEYENIGMYDVFLSNFNNKE